MKLRRPDAFSVNPLERAQLLANYERLLLQTFMTSEFSTFSGEEALKTGSSGTHCDPTFNPEIAARDRKRHKEGATRYTSTRELLLNHMEKLEILKFARYQALLVT